MEFVLWIAGVFASGFLSWLFTHWYYRKAMARDAAEASAQLTRLNKLVEQGQAAADLRKHILRQTRIQDCVAEHQSAGTPVGLIDTYGDLSTEDKADLLDAVFMRIKGRRPKVNKYRAKNGAT